MHKGPGIIVDPFAGSCSTMQASGKDCFCGDVDSYSLDVSHNYIQQKHPFVKVNYIK